MTEELKVTIERRGDAAILYTRGYINNVGGEEIANRAYELIDGGGVRTLLLNLRETKIVNSIGISILIEIIEKMNEKGGRLAFCCLTPVIQKTFQIMGLAQYAPIFPDEDTATRELPIQKEGHA
jgi:anti-anti-sigma factor